jgi:hypothetical protein
MMRRSSMEGRATCELLGDSSVHRGNAADS